MQSYRILTCILFLCSIPGVFITVLKAVRPDFKLQHLTSRDGLPGDYIEDIIQDQQGFIWLATRGGLARFNGIDFDIWQHAPNDSNSLPHSFVTALQTDPVGNLWVGTVNGLCRLNLANNRIQQFKHLGPLSYDWITKIILGDQENLWIGTNESGLFRLQPASWDMNIAIDSSQCTCFQVNRSDSTSLSSNLIYDLTWDGERQVLWVATAAGLCLYNPIKNGFYRLYFDKSNDRLSQVSASSKYNYMLCLFLDKSSAVWIGTAGGVLLKILMKEKKIVSFKSYDFEKFHSSFDSIIAITQDKFGDIWFTTRFGHVFKLDPRNNTNQRIHQFTQKSRDNVLSDPYVIRFDNSSILWIGTRYGLHFGEPFKKGITQVSYDPNREKSLSIRWVTALAEADDGHIWAGTVHKGLEIVDSNLDVIKSLQHDPKDKSSLCSNGIHCLLKRRNGTLWVGTTHGLDLFQPATEQFFHLPKKNKKQHGLAGNHVFCLYEDFCGATWIGTNKGVSKIGIRGHQFEITNYLTNPDAHLKKLGGYVGAIAEVSPESYLIGSKGLYRFSEKNDQVHPYQHHNHPWIDDMIVFIERDSKNSYWIGTVTDGLYQLTTDGQQIHFTTREGLPSNFVCSLIEDSTGCLWIGTFTGLVKYEPKKNVFKKFERPARLENEFRWRAFHKGQSGRFYFGNYYGFLMFNPKDLGPNPRKPPVYLTNFKIYNQPVFFEQPLYKRDEITLSFKDRMFSFDFVALNYRNSEDNQYAYRLLGFNDEWIDTRGTRTAQFTNFPPGHYTFQVKASNNDGVWNEQGASMKICILPPWWRTTWAWLLWIGLFSGLIYTVYRIQLNRARLQQQYRLKHEHAEKLAQLDQLKSNFFANISHEFRTPLTLIQGPIKQMLSGDFHGNLKGQYRLILRNSERLLQLINQLLDLSKFEVGKMSLLASEDNIASFVKSIVMSFHSLAERKHIKFTFKTSNENLRIYFDQDKVEKIFNNLLSNAFKFTPDGGEISVTITEDKSKENIDWVIISVKDNGTGIPTNKIDKIFDRFYQVDSSQKREFEGAGIGLALTKELVELHRGRIQVQSEAGKGTEFRVYLLKGDSHLQKSEIKRKPKMTMQQIEYSPVDEKLNEVIPDTLTSDTKIEKQLPLVLVVEDNRDVQMYIKQILESRYKIMTAFDGLSGFDKAINKIPDLIISDVMMPKMDGFELCEKLKTDERTSHIPVILLTARASDADKLQGLETGADDYLIKPFDAREMLVRISNLIQQRRKLRERYSNQNFIDLKDVALTSADERFLLKVVDILEQNYKNPEYSVEQFVKNSGMSRVQLHRKLAALTNQSASEFIRTFRLKKAALLIKHQTASISEIAFEVGFNNLSYFARSFKKLFGVLPSDYHSSQTS